MRALTPQFLNPYTCRFTFQGTYKGCVYVLRKSIAMNWNLNFIPLSRSFSVIVYVWLGDLVILFPTCCLLNFFFYSARNNNPPHTCSSLRNLLLIYSSSKTSYKLFSSLFLSLSLCFLVGFCLQSRNAN